MIMQLNENGVILNEISLSSRGLLVILFDSNMFKYKFNIISSALLVAICFEMHASWKTCQTKTDWLQIQHHGEAWEAFVNFKRVSFHRSVVLQVNAGNLHIKNDGKHPESSSREQETLKQVDTDWTHCWMPHWAVCSHSSAPNCSHSV